MYNDANLEFTYDEEDFFDMRILDGSDDASEDATPLILIRGLDPITRNETVRVRNLLFIT
jgi:hypothetical protein